MANREALRELQERLAGRLRAAQSLGASVAWLAVKAGGANYLLPLGQAGEIFPVANLQTVPYVKPWFLGVLNIRGGLFGVIDFAQFVASETAASVATGVVAEPSVITINPMLEVNCALQVDNLIGLRGGDAFSASSSPPADAPIYFGNRFLDAEGGSWQEIDLRLLANSSQFLSISA